MCLLNLFIFLKYTDLLYLWYIFCILYTCGEQKYTFRVILYEIRTILFSTMVGYHGKKLLLFSKINTEYILYNIK